ncbi:heavy metal-associated isoprenylated plant protein 20-like [Tripterygium wilfordii]|uniref:heavy metal-associated isoprenylated plant protein 20-like n=1 Tax=Tripterygium wilfordii TaxID=458696 RepID=UPI0018F81B45|nr:heavy metal-associated isoprenylated plant protein 20-like [Tripterygium wilfordii]
MMPKLGSWAIRLPVKKTRFLPVEQLLPRITRSIVNPLTNSQVHEVVLAADLGCAKCREKVADAISRLDEMESVVVHVVEKKICWMVMKINMDCNGCYRKVRRALLSIQELETHLIEKKQSRVSVCGRFSPQEVAIKIRSKTNRRVEILHIQDLATNINNTDNIERVMG